MITDLQRAGPIYLCDNGKCSSHCLVEMAKDGLWAFAGGLKCALTDIQLQGFDPNAELNLCSSCRGAYDMAVHLKFDGDSSKNIAHTTGEVRA